MNDLKQFNIFEHLDELKYRIIYVLCCFFVAFLTSYFYIEQIYFFLLKPLDIVWHSSEKHLIYTNLIEFFFSNIKLAYYASWFVTLPFLFIQLYLFVAPGLYNNEKKWFVIFLFFSPLLFLLGMLFVYYIILPLSWSFFLSYENISFGDINVKLEAKISEYLNLIVSMILAFGMAFQIPILLALSVKIGLIDAKFLKAKRRFAIVIIFVVAAFLTPPDIVSQILLAVPMLLLYEISINICNKISKD